MRVFLFFLMNSTLFAQPLTLTIDSIVSKDSLPHQREFKLKYHITNNTNDTVRFFLDNRSLTPNISGSLSRCPYYKIYENDIYLELGPVFQPKGNLISSFSLADDDSSQSESDFENKYIIYLSTRYKMPLDSLQTLYKKVGFAAVSQIEGKKYYEIENDRKSTPQIVLPNEQLEGTSTFYWDKNRYFFRKPQEFILDENAKHYFEITLVALKEELKGHIKPEVYDKIMKLPNFIKGVFTSNKVEINLKE